MQCVTQISLSFSSCSRNYQYVNRSRAAGCLALETRNHGWIPRFAYVKFDAKCTVSACRQRFLTKAGSRSSARSERDERGGEGRSRGNGTSESTGLRNDLADANRARCVISL